MPFPSVPPSMWPVLVADLADAAARDFLEGIALARGKAFLPLIAAPANASTHVLEIHAPGVEPLIVFAEPAGVPTAVGFPLRLRPYDPNAVPRARSTPKLEAVVGGQEPDSKLRAKHHTKHTLSAHHTQDLSGGRVPRKPESLVGRVMAGGKLRIDGLIGTGGVGCVYKAFHRDLRIPLAVKVLHEDFQQDIEFCRRFHAEALAASSLDHANLMRVIDFGQEADGLLYLAMELLAGNNLGSSLDAGRPLPLTRTIDIMVQVCAGLGHAHSRGIVHRDIKPDNIVLVASRDDDDTPIELVKVCDFGIAMQPSEGGSSVVVGTPEYMSPEQCAGLSNIDGRSDVYSCGVVLYELATGQRPFTGATPVALLNRHMNMPPPRPRSVCPDVSAGLEEVILRALAKEPEDRYPSMRELRNDLRNLDSASRTDARRAIATPTKSADAAPEWLETGGGYANEGVTSSPGTATATSTASSPGYRAGEALANELAAKPAPWLAKFAESTRADAFEVLAAELSHAVPVLIDQCQVRTLFAIRSTIDVLAVDQGGQPSWRRKAARSLQLTLEDPKFLAVLAEMALSREEPAREVIELLLRAGPPGAYALYSSRLKLTNHAGIKKRFVNAIRRFGNQAFPMIRAGLAKLEPRRELLVASSLAADLFVASPRVKDDVAGEIAARYIQDGSNASLTRAAVEAIVAFWGERATPILIGLLGAHDDDVLLAAVRALRDLRSIDERVAAKMTVIARSSANPEVAAAVKAILADAQSASRRGCA